MSVVALGLLLYLQLFLSARPPYGQQNPELSPMPILTRFVFPLLAGMPIDYAFYRLRDFLPVLTTGLGFLVLPIFWSGKFKGRNFLLVMGGLTIMYSLTTVYSAHVEYMVFAFACLAVIAGVGLARKGRGFLLRGSLVLFPIVLLGMNVGFYDIGRTLDTTPTHARDYVTALEGLPEGSIIFADPVHVYTVTQWYVMGENKNKLIHTGAGAIQGFPWELDTLEYYGLTIPEEFRERVTYKKDTLIRLLRDANPGRKVYWGVLSNEKGSLVFEIFGTDSDGNPLEPVVPVGDVGGPSRERR